MNLHWPISSNTSISISPLKKFPISPKKKQAGKNKPKQGFLDKNLKVLVSSEGMKRSLELGEGVHESFRYVLPTVLAEAPKRIGSGHVESRSRLLKRVLHYGVAD